MTIQVNDVFGSDKHTEQKSKDSASLCVMGEFIKLVAGYVKNTTDTEMVSGIVSDISKTQIQHDRVSEVECAEIRGYLPFTFMASDTAAKREKEVISKKYHASVDLHITEYFLAGENKSKLPDQLLIPSESTDTMLQETNAPVVLAKLNSFRLPVSVDSSYDSLYAKPIDSVDAHLIQPPVSYSKNNIDSFAVRDLIASELKVPSVKELSDKQEHYVPDQKPSGDMIPESTTRPDSVQFLVGKINHSKSFKQEKHIVLDYVDSSSLPDIDAQKKLNSDGSSDPKSLVLGEMSKQSFEVTYAIQKGLPGKAAGWLSGEEHTGLFMPGKVKSLNEEIHDHATEKQEKVSIGLKQVFEQVFTETQHDGGLDESSKELFQSHIADEFDDFKAIQREKHIALNSLESASSIDDVEQGRLKSEGSKVQKSLFMDGASENEFVLQHAVLAKDAGRDGEFFAKATRWSLGYERTGMLLHGGTKPYEEIRPHLKESSGESLIELKQAFEPVFTDIQHDSGFESSYNNFKSEYVSEQVQIERQESLFRSILAQTANSSKAISHLPEAFEKYTNIADVLIQVAERITVMSAEGRTEMEVQIHPESLGKLLLKVVNENGLYSAHIITETYQAKELVQSHLNELKAALKDQGFNFFNLDVSFSNSQSNNQQWTWWDRFLLKQNGNGNLGNGKNDQTIERAGKTYGESKSSGYIDCLV